jgi:hypothetical protein
VQGTAADRTACQFSCRHSGEGLNNWSGSRHA